MSSINPAIAIKNYQHIMGLGGTGIVDSGATAATPGFQDILKKTLNQTAEAVRQHESIAIQHTIGEADLTQLITSAAELDVKTNTVVALRDKLTAIIQELEKMQI